MRHSMEVRSEAVRCFDLGFSEASASKALGVSESIVEKRPYAYRALGKEALLVTKHRKYDHETKVGAARAVIEGRMTKPEAMKAYGLRSKTQTGAWCKLYRQGGPDALLPKPKGRPRKTGPVFHTREEEPEARVRELELENEILKRFGALAEEIEQRRQIRYESTPIPLTPFMPPPGGFPPSASWPLRIRPG